MSLSNILSHRNHVAEVFFRMNGFSLDSIGLAVFGHDFGALDGKDLEIPKIIDSIGMASSTTFENILARLSYALPFLTNIPTARSRIMKRLHDCLGEIGSALLERNSRDGDLHDKSVIATLRKSTVWDDS